MSILVPNTALSDGQSFNGDLATLAFEAPIFDDQPQYLGHRVRLTDAELDNAPTAIKTRVATMSNSLLVSVETGRTLRYQSGTVSLLNGDSLNIASGLVTAPDDVTSFVYVDPLGVVRCDSSPSVTRVMLAKVVTVSGLSSVTADLRSLTTRYMTPIALATKIFGGSSQVDRVINQGEVISDGIVSCRNFTVNAGISATVDRWLKIYASGNVVINGNVTVTQLASGGAGYGTGVNGGNVGGSAGSGAGGGSGSGGQSSGRPYTYGAQPYGSGGGVGFAQGINATLSFGSGGTGGGGIIIEAAGTITVNGTITARGGNAEQPIAVTGNIAISGSGGGSGGLIVLSSLISVIIALTATLDVKGGNGGNAVNNGGSATVAQGGSSGGGGVICIFSPSFNYSGATLTLSPGNMGANSLSGTPQLGGGSGGGFGGQGGIQGLGSSGKLITGLFNPQGI